MRLNVESRIHNELCPTLRANAGDNQVSVAYGKDDILHPQNSGGVERDSYGKKAGKGALIQWERSATLGVSQDQTLFVLRETEQDHPITEMDTE